ncbi:MAG TPA: hypothetical protein VF817_05290 [Patescibacteria group bacterium]
MARKLPVTSTADLDLGFRLFKSKIRPTTEEETRLDFCKAFIAVLLQKNLSFMSSWNDEKREVCFMGTAGGKGQPRLTLYYEKGTYPICFWQINERRERLDFNALQMRVPTDMAEKAYAAWRQGCEKAKTAA